MRTILTLCLFGTVLYLGNLAQAAGGYTFIPIPKPVGNTGTAAAQGVNESGVVAGAVAPAPNTESFVWDLQNGLHPFKCNNEKTVACGINDQGQVVGFFGDDYRWEAFIWQNDTYINLGKVPGYNQVIPNAINNQGTIVGYCSSGPFRAMIGDATTGLRLLPGVGDQNHSMSYARGISNQNKVVGYWEDNGFETAYVWENNTPHTLAPLAIGQSSRAQGINDLGVIVGMSGSNAVMWDNAGFIHDLGTLGTLAEALAVNSQGITVGRSIVNGIEHAFVWKNEIMYDLNTLVSNSEELDGWILNGATAINDSGMIVGYGTNENGQYQAFALVPEPATMLLLGFGGLALRKRIK